MAIRVYILDGGGPKDSENNLKPFLIGADMGKTIRENPGKRAD